MNIPLKNNTSLSSLSTFNIGGVAKQFISVDTPEKLLDVVKWADDNKKRK